MRTSLFFTVLKVPLDYTMIVAAALTAYFMRFHTTLLQDVRPISYVIPLSQYVQWSFLYAALLVVIFALLHLYSLHQRHRIFDEFFTLVAASSWGILAGVLIMFLTQSIIASRFILVALWVLSIIFVMTGRTLVRIASFMYRRQGKGLVNVVMVGNTHTAHLLAHEFTRHQGWGYRVAAQHVALNASCFQELVALHAKQRIDSVMVLDATMARRDLLQLLEFCDQRHIMLRYSADLFGARAPMLASETIGGVPLLTVKRTPLEGWGKIFKRGFDIVGSLVLLIIISPVLLLVALAISLDSRGPILFSRRDDGSPLLRIGQYMKPFVYYKFRSMIDKSDSLRYSALKDLNTRRGPLVKIKDDPRVTRVGRFLRRFSLDELPELFLVLKGDMSLVGPRPHLPEEVARYDEEYKRLFLVKPGITGMAQVSGRSDLDFNEEVKLDIFYIENWSFLVDMIILLKTPWVVLKGVEG